MAYMGELGLAIKRRVSIIYAVLVPKGRFPIHTLSNYSHKLSFFWLNIFKSRCNKMMNIYLYVYFQMYPSLI